MRLESAFSFAIILLINLNYILSITNRPLVLIHGLKKDQDELQTLQHFIAEDFPHLKTISLSACNGIHSFEDLWNQVETFSQLVKEVTDELGDINLLGFSQGGLIARAVIETSSNPHIRTFISLSAPAVGQYGLPYLEEVGILDDLMREEVVDDFCYAAIGQQISFCNYWKDPLQYEEYLKYNKFLPYINNEINHVDAEKFRQNFKNLEKLVVIGGPDDGVIVPWQSSHYMFYDSELNIVGFDEQPWVKEDWFGLKSLDEEKKIEFYVVRNVEHHYWPRSEIVYEKCIKPHL